MEVFEAVRTALAVRAFQDKAVSQESIDRIVDAGRLTASGMNAQPWHFLVIQNRDTLKKLGETIRTGPYTAQAAFAVVVAVEKTPYALSDGSRAIQSMILTAWSEGIGSNWTGFLPMPQVNALFGIPESLDVLAVVPFGYPAKTVGKGKKKRKDAADVISYEKFGQSHR